MAHCNNFGCNNLDCGCKDTYLTTPPPCPTPVDCPEAQPCSEVFDSQCIVYTASNILCDGDVVVEQNSTVQSALQDIVNYFCPPLKKFVKVFENVTFDGASVTILKSELTACGLLSEACGTTTFTDADFTYSIYYLNNNVWTSIGNLDTVLLRVNSSGNIVINFNNPLAEPGVTVRVVIVG